MRLEVPISWSSILSRQNIFQARPLVCFGLRGLGSALQHGVHGVLESHCLGAIIAGLQRCGKSCRLRWTNYLRPDIRHGSFTSEEEDLIVKLHASHGSRYFIYEHL